MKSTAKRQQSHFSPMLFFAAIALAMVLSSAPAMAQTETVLYSFGALPYDVTLDRPTFGLVADQAGNLFGTAFYGGPDKAGGAFELNRHTAAGQPWDYSTLFTFSRGFGQYPSGVIFDKAGNLYGTTLSGGKGFGTAFELSPTTGTSYSETVLYEFQNNLDGWEPQSGLIFDSAGNLYGTTTNGGELQGGTAFKLSPPATSGGSWTKTTIHSFGNNSAKQPFAGGCEPLGSLTLGPRGTLYGVTFECGASGAGVVFQLTPPTSGDGEWQETVLHTFGGAGDGAKPYSGVVVGKGGYLYGTTGLGGANGFGTVYQLVPPSIKGGSWTENILYSFANGDDGGMPFAPVTLASDGTLYGTASQSGSGVGVVYQLTPPGSAAMPWTQSVVYGFSGGADGGRPTGGVLVLGGALFGTTTQGGANKEGVVYEITF